MFNFGRIQGNHLEVKELGTWNVDTGKKIFILKAKYNKAMRYSYKRATKRVKVNDKGSLFNLDYNKY